MLLPCGSPGKVVKSQSVSSRVHCISFFHFKAEFSGKFMIFRNLENIKVLLQNITCERREGKHTEHVPEQVF